MLEDLDSLAWVVGFVEGVNYHEGTLFDRLNHGVFEEGLGFEEVADDFFVVGLLLKWYLVRYRYYMTVWLVTCCVKV